MSRLCIYKSDDTYTSFISNVEPVKNYPFIKSNEYLWKYYVELLKKIFNERGLRTFHLK
ncbi:MAG: hypothetical protein IH948_03405 [Bacteroidetes bacterium]|nr:hypothetical protein [Bacteroidota bacterium]